MSTTTNGSSTRDLSFPVLPDPKVEVFAGIPRRRGQLDPLVLDALEKVKERHAGSARKALAKVRKAGATDNLAQVHDRLNRSGLHEIARLLLSEPDVFGALMEDALASDHVKSTDIPGIVDSIRQNIEESPYRGTFEGALVAAVFAQRNIAIDTDTESGLLEYQRVLRRVRETRIPLTPGGPVEAIVRIQTAVSEERGLPEMVHAWAGRQNQRVDDDLVARMTARLKALGISFEEERADAGEYDGYFAIAFDAASRESSRSSDPIVLTRPQAVTVSPWDFRVETFESAEEQGVLPDNIRAAGALDYVYNLGELLGVYKLADALVLRWASGVLDIEDGDLSSQLYRYWQLREDRVTPEERGMLYKRVLNKGGTELLSRMVVNESFPRLWGKLMSTVADYIADTSDAADTKLVSRVPIYRATKELQHNLTEHMTGMAHMQVTDMYMQLRDAFDLLAAPEITQQLSAGRRRNVWATIERLHREEYESAADVAGLRTIAVEGNRVFQWVAEFQEGATAEASFETFRDAAESWIIAAAALGEMGADALAPQDGEEDDEPDFGDDAEEEGEDW